MYSDILMPFVGIFPRTPEEELFLFAILQAKGNTEHQPYQITTFLRFNLSI